MSVLFLSSKGTYIFVFPENLFWIQYSGSLIEYAIPGSSLYGKAPNMR